jgi:hypothetical protein
MPISSNIHKLTESTSGQIPSSTIEVDDVCFSSFPIMPGFVPCLDLSAFSCCSSEKASARRHFEHFNLEASVGVRMHRNIVSDFACFCSRI